MNQQSTDGQQASESVLEYRKRISDALNDLNSGVDMMGQHIMNVEARAIKNETKIDLLNRRLQEYEDQQ